MNALSLCVCVFMYVKLVTKDLMKRLSLIELGMFSILLPLSLCTDLMLSFVFITGEGFPTSGIFFLWAHFDLSRI